MDGFFAAVAGKIVSIFVMWAMLGIILWFGAQLPITALIVKPMFGVYDSASKKAAAGVAKFAGEAAAYIVKFAINLGSFVIRLVLWMAKCVAQAVSQRLRGIATAPTYDPAPEWINHFPPPKKKKGGGGH